MNDSFLSIVAHKYDATKMLVRSRVRGDIQKSFPTAVVDEDQNADYYFRSVISREEVADAISRKLIEVDYPNFKGSVEDDTRHNAYTRIWSTMLEFGISVSATPEEGGMYGNLPFRSDYDPNDPFYERFAV